MDFDSKFERRESPFPLTLETLAERLRSLGLGEPENPELLGGGFSNSNYRLRLEGVTRLLRISRRPLIELGAELEVLQSVAPFVRVPRPLLQRWEPLVPGAHFLLQEFVPGVRLDQIEEKLADLPFLAKELGQALAAIHRIEFAESGFFQSTGTGLGFRHKFADFGQGMLHYFEECFENERLQSRLSPDTLRELRALVRREESTYLALEPTRRLVHSDFNQKNLLVHPDTGHLSAVLDWEFAFAGSPLIDFGNFFRFESEMPEGYLPGFVDGYREAGGELPEGWRWKARLLDLLAVLNFLTAPQDRPRTFATARSVIEETLHIKRTA